MPGALIYLVITLVVVGLIYWVIQQLPIPEPFGNIIRVVFIVAVCIYLLYFLVGFLPVNGSLFPHRGF